MSFYKRGQKRKYSYLSFEDDDRGGYYSKTPKYSHKFLWKHPSTLQMRVSHYGRNIMLHFTKGQKYLPVRESEFYDLLNMTDDIKKHIKKCKNLIKPLYKDYVDDINDDEGFTTVPVSKRSLKLKQKRKEEFLKKKAETEDSQSEHPSPPDSEAEGK